MVKESKILFTGGGGLLGSEVKKVIPKALFPSSRDFDVTKAQQMRRYLVKHRPKLIIHAAAFMPPAESEKKPLKALQVNIAGTANLVELCFKFGIKMVYISTDYVFKGDKGGYKEDDPVLPMNKYAWSKLGGECAVKLLSDYLIIRTSLGSKVFPYEKAFTDHFTSKESADIIAKKIVKIIKQNLSGTIHLGAKRRSVYEYARGLKNSKTVGRVSTKRVGFTIPRDTSLNTNKYLRLFSKK